MFFEEELKELEIPDIEQLAKLSPEEVEELLSSIEGAKKTDAIDVEESYAEIVGALKVKFDEIEEAEELDEGAQKRRLIRTLPSFVIDHFQETWLENLSIDELNELTQLTEAELKIVIDSLAAAKETLEESPSEAIDYDEELERLDHVESTVDDAQVEDLDDVGVEEVVKEPKVQDTVEEPTIEEPEVEDAVEEPIIEELEDQDTVEEPPITETEVEDEVVEPEVEESESERIDIEDKSAFEEELEDLDAEEELPEVEDDDDFTDWYQ
jgi:hypothetical protein